MQTRKNLAAGMNPEQARRQARVQFGTHEEAVKDYVRDTRRLGFLETFLHDLRYALRGLRHAPVFTLTVVLTIGLGLGWNTAAFTIFNAYVLRPLAVPDPYSLYGLTWSDRVGRTHLFTWEQSQQFRNSDSPFQLAGAVNYNVRVRMDGHLAQGQLVDADYFRILGLDAVQGRTFLPEDVRAPGSEPLV